MQWILIHLIFYVDLIINTHQQLSHHNLFNYKEQYDTIGVRKLQDKPFEWNNPDVAIELYNKKADNTWVKSRDQRIFATDSGYIKIHFTKITAIDNLTCLSLNLDKGITLIQKEIDKELFYTITQNITETFINFTVPSTILLNTLYLSFTPIVFKRSLRALEEIKERMIIKELKLNDQTSEVKALFFNGGKNEREIIALNVTQESTTLPSYVVFVLNLSQTNDNKLNQYYLKILYGKDEIDQKELMGCQQFKESSIPLEITDCDGKTNVKDCPYYYQIELYFDPAGKSNCTVAGENDIPTDNNQAKFYGSSNMVFYPPKKEESKTETPENNSTSTITEAVFPLNTIIIVVTIGAALIGIVIFIMYKVYRHVNDRRLKQLRIAKAIEEKTKAIQKDQQVKGFKKIDQTKNDMNHSNINTNSKSDIVQLNK